ncbi:MAG TPA: DUF6458 family protein [Nocardioidaceae bacterium]|nr:DUF6458 family protein [Nocardioidaceae bacterium]
MGWGIFLMVLGAILALAVRQGDSPTVDLDTVGVILFAAGVAVVLLRQHRTTQERVVTHIDDTTDPNRVKHTVIERSDPTATYAPDDGLH